MSLLPGKQRAEFHRERWDRDWYVKPYWCIEALFKAVKFKGPIHDPCCGEGRIVEVARNFGYEASGSDIAERGFGSDGEDRVDFLADMTPRTTLIFNPPGKPPGGPNWTDLFIKHALEVATSAVAMIVPVPYLAGQDRYRKLYRPHPPSKVLICSRRPSMPPGGRDDIPAQGGTTDYCWIMWRTDNIVTGEPHIEWLAP